MRHFWLDIIYTDPGLNLYIFRLDLDKCEYLIHLIEDFTKIKNFAENTDINLNLIKLIYDIKILDDSDRIYPYMTYFSGKETTIC